jgi:ferric-dicitrate binding protein FerR (iron transport regulator)
MTPGEAREFDRLVSGYCDGGLTPDEFADLERRVRTDPGCRRRYLELTALHGSLHWALASDSAVSEPAAPARPRRWRSVAAVAGLAVAVAVAVAAWVVTRPGARPEEQAARAPEPFARVVEVGGRAEVGAAGREPAEAGEGTPVFPGQTVRTDGADGFAVLDLGGGSRLELGADAQLRVADGSRLVLTSGLLRGAAGAVGVLVQTPQAEVSLRDARFLLSAAPDVTEVEAESGSVRVVRASDGRVMEVAPGSAAVVSTAEVMELRAAPVLATPRAEYKVAAHAGVAFTPDGKTLVARPAKGGGWARIDLASGRVEPTKLALGEPTPVGALSADAGTYLAAAKLGRVRVFDPRTGAERGGFDVGGPGAGLWALSADGRRAAFARPAAGPGDKVRVWEVPAGRELPAVTSPAQPRCLAVSADGRRVAWGTDGANKRPGHALTVWDVDAGKVVAAIPVPDRPLRELAFSPDGRRVAGGTDHGAVHVWEADTGRWVAGRGAADGWARPVRALEFAPDGRLAAGLADGRVRLWDPDAGGDAGVLECGRSPVTGLAFAPDGRTLAAVTNRGPVTLWDLPPAAD